MALTDWSATSLSCGSTSTSLAFPYLTATGFAWDESVVKHFGLPPLARPTGDADTQRSWDAGAAMTVDEAVEFAVRITSELSARPADG